MYQIISARKQYIQEFHIHRNPNMPEVIFIYHFYIMSDVVLKS